MIAWDTAINAVRRYLGLPTSHREFCERFLEDSRKALHIEEQYLLILELWEVMDLTKVIIPHKRIAVGLPIKTHSPDVSSFVRYLDIISVLIHNEDRAEMARYIQNNFKARTTQSLDSWLVDSDGLPEKLDNYLKAIQDQMEFQRNLFDLRNINSYGWSLTKVYDDLYAVSAIVVSLLGD